MSELLFSYGTLQLESVQRAIFGGPIHGEPDAVVAHRLEDLTITDRAVIAASGTAVHPMLVASDDPASRVPGTLFTLDAAQLAAADAYEVDAYVRVRVPLASGRTAWVYALASGQQERADGSAGDADYGRIGFGYAHYRQPDPVIAEAIRAALGDAQRVVNVGAGAGSYEPADREVVPIEPSATMRAQRSAGLPAALEATAEALPLADASVDAAMATFTVHQWRDLDTGLAEMVRVSRGPIVVLTCDPLLLDRFWLAAYAPEVIDTEARRYPPIAQIVAGLAHDGRNVTVASIGIPLDCRDGFGEAYYGRPEALLDPGARLANSAWSFVGDDVSDRFVTELSGDLADGTWDARWGHLRTQASFDGSLVLIVSRPH